MRLTTVILIASLMQVSAASLAQKVTLNKSKAPLKTVLKELRQQSGYIFVFGDNVLKSARPVTIDVRDIEFEQVLKMVFSDQPLQYAVSEKTIAIATKPETKGDDKFVSRLLTIDVHGTVVDGQGKPIAGATVRVKEGKGYTITDEKGNFFIKNVNEGVNLVITFIGFNAKEISAHKEMGNIKMETATSKLDEVIVQAYGKTSQRLSTGNIQSIYADQIEKKPVSNALLALQGEVPGIVIGQSGSYANSGVQIQIQGLNSMTQGNDPFFVVDGVPYISQLPANFNSVAGSTAPLPENRGSNISSTSNPMSFINPFDIESISVLKGADATSIYGARAANGAILITTKKGKPGESKISLNIQQGFSKYKPLATLGRDEYLQLRRDAYFGTDKLTENSPEWASQYDLNGTWDNTHYTDWQKEIAGKAARYSDYSISMSGGNVFDQYFVSGTYHKENVPINYLNLNDQKISFHINLNHESDNKRFKTNFTANYQNDVNEIPNGDAGYMSILLSPVAPSIFSSDGTINWAQNANGISTFTGNPYIRFLNTQNLSKTTNLVSNLNLTYFLAKGFNFQSTFGFSSLRQDESQFNLATGTRPEARSSARGSNIFNKSSVNLWSIEPQLRYESTVFKGKMEIVVGGALQSRKLEQSLVYGSNYNNDLLIADLASASAIRGTTNVEPYRFASFFGRINYNLDDRYILNISSRQDGSSKFGENNLTHTFWSIGGAYLLSNESFIKDKISWLSFAKLRSSYGTTGSDGIASYSYLNTYSSRSLPVNYQNTTALVLNGLPNPNLQWEETKKIEFGLDLGFFNDRLLLGTNYFRNRSSNQLLNYNLPYLTGAGAYATNFPALVQNSGFELTLNSINFQGKRFIWNTSFNFSTVRNKLVDFPGLQQSGYENDYIIGQSIFLAKLYEYAGVNPTTGLYQFVASNGTLTSSPNFDKDRTIVLDRLATFSGGITNTFKFDHFQLSFLIQFVKKNALNFQGGLFPGYADSSVGNQPAYFTNYWRNPGDVATFQKVTSTFTDGSIYTALDAAGRSNFGFGDASFARLKNISLSYSVPLKFLEKFHFSDFKVFANAQNIFTLTKFKGGDPEYQILNSTGPLKTFVIGAQISL